MQVVVNTDEDAIIQLLNGTRQPRPRNPVYVENDNRIEDSMQVFRARTTTLDDTLPNYDQIMDDEIAMFLNHVKHHLG